MPGPAGVQGAQCAVQFRGAGDRPEAPDDPHRETDQAAAHRGQCHQAGRVRPLQVIGADHDRPGQGKCLHQVTERVNHPELKPRIAGHRDRVPAAAPGRADKNPAIAARRGSAEAGTQPKAPASRPNGRARSSSSARPAAT